MACHGCLLLLDGSTMVAGCHFVPCSNHPLVRVESDKFILDKPAMEKNGMGYNICLAGITVCILRFHIICFKGNGTDGYTAAICDPLGRSTHTPFENAFHPLLPPQPPQPPLILAIPHLSCPVAERSKANRASSSSFSSSSSSFLLYVRIFYTTGVSTM